MRLEVTKRNVEVFLFRIEQGTGYVNGSPLNSVDPLGLDDCQPGGACADHAQQTQMPWLQFGAGAFNFSLNGTSTATLYSLGVTATTTFAFTFGDAVTVSDPNTGAVWASLGQGIGTSQTTLSYSDSLLSSVGGGGTPGSVQTTGTAPAQAGAPRRPAGLNSVTSVFGYDQNIPLPSCFGIFLKSALSHLSPASPDASAAGDAAGSAYQISKYNQALQYAASKSLVSPYKSSVFRNTMKLSGRGAVTGALVSVDISLGEGLYDEYQAMKAGRCQ